MRDLFLVALAACGGAQRPAAPTRLVEIAHVEHIDALAREAAIVTHPSGRMFVSGYGDDRPELWRSDDHGATWMRVAVGGEAEGAAGNSDVDLAVAPDGTLYFVTLVFDVEKLQGKQISIATSRDAGATWTWATLSTQPFDDRPWVAVTKDGAAHVIWSNEAGVQHAVSKDRGASWQHLAVIAEHGGSSHLVAGPNGELAARIVPGYGGGLKLAPGADLIAVSTDGGATWTTTPAPGERVWKSLQETEKDDTPRWVEPLAWDPGGDLFSLWTEKDGVHLARSHDRGTTWSQSPIAPANGTAYFPYLIATGPGQLAATWFTAAADDGSDLRWHLARIDGTHAIASEPLTLECLAKRGSSDAKLYNDTCGEYLMPIALPGGRLGVVGAIQNPTAKRLGFALWTFEAR